MELLTTILEHSNLTVNIGIIILVISCGEILKNVLPASLISKRKALWIMGLTSPFVIIYSYYLSIHFSVALLSYAFAFGFYAFFKELFLLLISKFRKLIS